MPEFPPSNRMKAVLLFAPLSCLFFSAESVYGNGIRILSESDAARIVAAEEQAKEKAGDEREAELLAAEITATAVADLGHRKVVFNRVAAPTPEVRVSDGEDAGSASETVVLAQNDFPDRDGLEQVNVVLSGTVYDDAVSEIWWRSAEGEHLRVFVHADYRYFSGIADVSDEAARYSLFTIIGGESTAGGSPTEKWRPTPADFTSGALEYFIMEWGTGDEPDADDFKVIDATLRYYAEHVESMRIRYENNRKLAAARRAYLEANPPKTRDVIVNYRPFGEK